MGRRKRDGSDIGKIDTNVLFYSLDADEVAKQPKAIALTGRLTESADTVLPWKVACEF